MKEGDKVYCIKEYIDSDGDILNIVNEKYTIVRINNFYSNENDKVISVETSTDRVNVFWLKYQQFNDNWDNMRKENLFNDYFITERKLKLQKLNESR
jgi:hypothetical protein